MRKFAPKQYLNIMIMKRFLFVSVFACCAIALVAQNSIRVKFTGAQPTVSDFVTAYMDDYVYDEDDDVLDESRNYMKSVWAKHLKGQRLDGNDKLLVDKKNGYVSLESYDGEFMLLVEMCYWNESDGKHKLFAYNVRCFKNGQYDMGQFDGLTFCRYNNATKTMKECDPPGFEQKYGTDDGASVSYSLPRVGKDIILTKWYENGRTKKQTLKWNGRKFTAQ